MLYLVKREPPERAFPYSNVFQWIYVIVASVVAAAISDFAAGHHLYLVNQGLDVALTTS